MLGPETSFFTGLDNGASCDWSWGPSSPLVRRFLSQKHVTPRPQLLTTGDGEGLNSLWKLSRDSAGPCLGLKEVEVGGHGSGSARRSWEGNINSWFRLRRESRGCCPVAQWVEAGKRLRNSVLCIFRRPSMDLERIVGSALLAFVQAHLPEADLR